MPYKYSKLRRLLFRNNVEKNLKQLTDEDFRRGLKFHAKYVGSLEISRPVSRVEIVAAMRRVRFEFRVRGSKKKKVSINVSVDGVQVNLTNRRRALVSHHPISKIFYVSHDSQDLKIFSYITSNETSKIFRCNVFKSFKMSQAVEIVKTIGQAFDVCHKLSVESNKQNCEPLGNYESPNVEEHLLPLEQPLTPSTSNIFHAPQPTTITLDSTDKYKIIGSVTLPDSRTYNGFFQAERWDRLRQQVADQKQQNDLILIQMQVLQNQLEAEHSSRINAEVQMQDLMRENQNLLFRIHSMMRQVLLRSDSVIDASKSNPVKNKEIEFSVQNDVSSSSFDGTFFHQSPDSGHDDTISSTLSRFRNANTWRSSACQFQLGDESGLNDDREKSEVIENSFHQENSAILATSPMPGSSLFADSVGSSRTNFSKHLPVVG